MTITELQSLAERLTNRLERDTPSPSDFEMASAYVTACSDANARLRQCAQMIAEGSLTQVLRLAAEKPNLLDVAATLNFPRHEQWLELCRINGWPQAQPMDRIALRALGELYSAGSRSDQTKSLYRDYRAAKVTRDDARALEIVRAIVQLDPADQDAAAGLAQLERKVRENSLVELQAALASGDDRSVVVCLERCEGFEIDGGDDVTAARMVRARVQAEEARMEIARALPELAGAEAAGHWQKCGELASRITALSGHHDIPITPEDERRVQQALRYFETCRAESLRKARFAESLEKLDAATQSVRAMLDSPESNTLGDLVASRELLRECEEKAKTFHLEIPSNLLARASELGESLSLSIARLEKKLRLRRMLVGGSACVLLLCIASAGYIAIRAWIYTGEIRSLIAKKSTIPLRTLVLEIHSSWVPTYVLPYLQGALAEAENLLASTDDSEVSADAAVLAAKALADSGFADCTPESAVQVFQAADSSLAQLPPEIAALKSPELAEPRRRLEAWLAGQKSERAGAASKELEKAEALLQQVVLALEKDPKGARTILKEVDASLDSLGGWSDSRVSAVQFPRELVQRIAAVRQKSKACASDLDAYDSAVGKLQTAATGQEFGNALAALAKVPLPGTEMVDKAAALWPEPVFDFGQLAGQILLPASPVTWSAVSSASELRNQIFPTEARDEEEKWVRELANQRDIKDIYKAQLEKRGPASTLVGKSDIYTRGKIEPVNTVEDTIVWEGEMYEPRLSPARVAFEPRTITYDKTTSSGQGLDAPILTPESRAWAKMRPDGIADDSCKRFRESILTAYDRVNSCAAEAPLVGAYAFQELNKLLRYRTPEAWGAAWAPALSRDMEQLRTLVSSNLEGSEWLSPTKHSLGDKVAEWFKQRPDISYGKQARLHRELASRLLEEGGLEAYGFVGLSGKEACVTRPVPSSANVLWGFPEGQEKKIVPLFSRSPGQPWAFLAKGRPLGPLLATKVDIAPALTAAFEVAGISEQARAAYLKDLPPLFVPLAVSSPPNAPAR